ncbi:hypothetical protein GCM10007886_31050 [Methylobacterium gregans]|uniref:DUF3987 domain-containing protein n=2 Tax=Methylobacterium gregans TaxID=374424 RepID=A0AA37HSP7_9HYPH|nr:DUF3987 domain-containing protein [Methylobacterium gregans]MDQ0521657.1 hypothetical protein [Methylobacterium gregans]GJD80975.1 hypothetical protein NBEOAGPD_4220 [Methylobacterium gregans]GLS54921.1 hypothetical protein GCM10007886_31050 [Methylobacterium gregans]
MSEPHDPANENPEPGDAHAQQEALKAAFQEQASAKPTKSRWADPDTSLLRTSFDDAPRFPVEVLGPFWQTWVEQSARAANAPVDYTAGTLLATVGALLGNVRWPNVEGVWEHPSVLWVGLVGNPSTAKSPGMRPVRRLINQIEAKRAATIDGEGPAHRLKAVVADLKDKAWRRAVEEALAQDKPPPEWPEDAEIPAAPVMPVLHVVDATTEGLITTAAGSPRGLLQFSDELAGWFGGFDRYRAKGVSADRPFWLKAYDGDPYTVIRKGGDLKNGVRAPVEIPHLSIGVIGSVQPDPLRDFLTKSDDGLAHRFLWMWPDGPTSFRIPRKSDAHEQADDDRARAALIAIDDMTTRVKDRPDEVAVSSEATDLLQTFGQQMMDDARGKSAWYASTLNKAPGQALRLSAVLTFLQWSGGAEDTDPPTTIDAARMAKAIHLMKVYFLEQAKRVRQTATVGDGEADARAVLAILRERDWRDCFTGRQLQRVASGRLANTRLRKDACAILVEAGLLYWKPEREGTTKGREREEYRVNARVIFPQEPTAADTAPQAEPTEEAA